MGYNMGPIWGPYGFGKWVPCGSHMGNPYMDLILGYTGAYVCSLSQPCKSDELNMGCIWALNDIPVIKVGAIWSADIGAISFFYIFF